MFNDEDSRLRSRLTKSIGFYETGLRNSLDSPVTNLLNRFLNFAMDSKNELRLENLNNIQDSIFKDFDLLFYDQKHRFSKDLKRSLLYDYNQLSFAQKLRLSRNLEDFFKSDYNPKLRFDYKRFILDPNYESYYSTRLIEPQKLELFIAMGYRHIII